MEISHEFCEVRPHQHFDFQFQKLNLGVYIGRYYIFPNTT